MRGFGAIDETGDAVALQQQVLRKVPGRRGLRAAMSFDRHHQLMLRGRQPGRGVLPPLFTTAAATFRVAESRALNTKGA